jgi:hypothetical protein
LKEFDGDDIFLKDLSKLGREKIIETNYVHAEEDELKLMNRNLKKELNGWVFNFHI